jgi:hypothetical protein
MNWKEFLNNVSMTLIDSEDLNQEFKSTSQNWLGFEPATETEIIETEKRLQIGLPPSYKDFLRASNGFKQLSCFVWNILPVNSIEWLKEFDNHFVEVYRNLHETFNPSDEEYFVYGTEQETTNFRSKYLTKCLAISGWGDSSILLLNPEVKFGDEWEAWMFANWYPGPARYKSFEELMVEEYSAYVELLNERE